MQVSNKTKANSDKRLIIYNTERIYHVGYMVVSF